MAGGKERVLRRRIKSVESTKKITRAMELISASRIVKAQQRVAAARPYSEQITEVIRNLARGGAGKSHALLSERDTINKVGFVVIAADRGLAGGYNSTVIRAAERSLKEHQAQGRDYSLMLVGKKAADYFRFRGYRVDAVFTGMTDQPRYEDARQVADEVMRRFAEGDVDLVELAYTQFLSLGTQHVRVRRFVPIEAAAITEENRTDGPESDYEFEPEPDAILDKLLPRYAEARLFAAMLDASASEHAARQRAMKSATDNAEELITVLQRSMNRARQEAITTEISEIVGGAEALAKARSGGEDLLIDRTFAADLLPSHQGVVDR
ncbi:MAG: F0F1 ATP synthase subunit gamma [Actinobacteria bacterium]|nr:F0F1 ATP synthase subunit gamma [Actinomycetota bacterium]